MYTCSDLNTCADRVIFLVRKCTLKYIQSFHVTATAFQLIRVPLVRFRLGHIAGMKMQPYAQFAKSAGNHNASVRVRVDKSKRISMFRSMDL